MHFKQAPSIIIVALSELKGETIFVLIDDPCITRFDTFGTAFVLSNLSHLEN